MPSTLPFSSSSSEFHHERLIKCDRDEANNQDDGDKEINRTFFDRVLLKCTEENQTSINFSEVKKCNKVIVKGKAVEESENDAETQSNNDSLSESELPALVLFLITE